MLLGNIKRSFCIRFQIFHFALLNPVLASLVIRPNNHFAKEKKRKSKLDKLFEAKFGSLREPVRSSFPISQSVFFSHSRFLHFAIPTKSQSVGQELKLKLKQEIQFKEDFLSCLDLSPKLSEVHRVGSVIYCAKLGVQNSME